MTDTDTSRRNLLRTAALMSGALALGRPLPIWAQNGTPGLPPQLPTLSSGDIQLRIGHKMLRIDGQDHHAIGINGSVPAPLIRLREGQNARLTVVNELNEETSLHWHGLLVPFQMDGVPGVSFPGIPARTSFTYEFPLIQSGTYWYHSHSGLQEAMGLYGPLIVDPAGAEPAPYDREHVLIFSDHSAMHPHRQIMKLKQHPGHFNRQKQTLGGLIAGKDQSLSERLEWAEMRMDPTDISDVTGATYRYLVNGYGRKDNWTALFKPGERVRLRLINAAAMTFFNIRIPGLRMTVVQADGQNVRPIEVDELQMGVAETYDVIVTPTDERAYTIVGETVDRSGMAVATLAPKMGMTSEVPALRARPLATMRDMGMDMSSMSAGVLDLSAPEQPAMSHAMRDGKNAPSVVLGPGVQTISPMPVDRTGEPGQGLDDVGHKVLVYTDLISLDPNPDTRAASRQIEVHLTGNMERYMWSLDGQTLSEAHEPIPMREGERVRIILINDTMMAHPIHLHGHFFELVTGHGDHSPRKHTVIVAPGGKASFDVTAIAGDWAFHCHLFFHMHAGMMRIVQVRGEGDVA